MRRLWLNVITMVMILGVGATSLYIRGISSTDVTQVNSYKMDDGPYFGGKLTIIESLLSVPNEIEVSYSANTTVSVYIMTRGTYNSLSTIKSPPTEYLEKHEGVNGTLLYLTGDSNKNHIVAFYSEGDFILYERQISARYYSDTASEKQNLWMLNGMFIVLASALSAWSLIDSWKLAEKK